MYIHVKNWWNLKEETDLHLSRYSENHGPDVEVYLC